jgi:serine kinase of HPr protein (carbohydrate metabolism regulator)
MEHYGKPEPDWNQTLTIIRVNEEKKISEKVSGAGIRKKIMIIEDKEITYCNALSENIKHSAISEFINKDNLIVIKIDSFRDLIDFLQLGG